MRLLAADRIRPLAITDHAYQMPLGFDAEACIQHALIVMRGLAIAVELFFSKASAAWAKERLRH